MIGTLHSKTYTYLLAFMLVSLIGSVTLIGNKLKVNFIPSTTFDYLTI